MVQVCGTGKDWKLSSPFLWNVFEIDLNTKKHKDEQWEGRVSLRIPQGVPNTIILTLFHLNKALNKKPSTVLQFKQIAVEEGNWDPIP